MGVLFRNKSSQVEDVQVASDPESRDEITPEQSSDSPGAAESVPGDAPHGEHDASFTDDTEVDALEDEDVEEGEPAADESADTVAAATPAEAEQAEAEQEEEQVQRWYILKVQVNREESIRRALERRIKIAGLERFFGEIVVPTEDVAEYNKSGKRRIVKKKLYPGYLMIHLALNDDTWFLVRETPGIGDFTGSAGKPTPMADHEVQRIVMASKGVEAGESPIKTAIPFKSGDRVRVKEGYFENFEGDVDSIDEANGRVTVMINIFGRSTPVELEHWQMESI
jgi:transcriptional antiterminator NusG